ncbi:hypothetical protein OE903_01955 [Bacillus sp. B6(2022)]|nr:hypothetical protein [Bacillus sp. B6(2022)]
MTVYQLFHVQMLIQLVALGIGFFIFPLIQLYLFPFTTKFNFIHEHEIGTTNEELEIIDKGQAFARNFLVLPFMYYLILTSFLPILQQSSGLVNVLFAIYFAIVSVICWILCRKTIYKGIEYVEKIRYFLSENRLILRLGYFYAGVFIAALLIGSLLPYDQIPYLKRMKTCFSLYFFKQFTGWACHTRYRRFYWRHYVCWHSFYNGYIIGKLIQFLIAHHEVPQLFTGLMPHAFVEILGLILFSIVSAFPFIYLYRFMKGKAIDVRKLTRTVVQLIFSAVVLLLIASLLEEYVSHVHLS